MNDKVKGLILSQSDYKESDLLMQVITKEHGIISLVAKAAKKINSKNHFLPLCLYEFIIDYKDGKTIYTIHGNKLINKYFDEKNIEMMSFKNMLVELVLKNREIDCYDELLFVLDNIDNKNKYLLGSLFVSYFIKQFGIMPEVDRCVLCDNTKVVSISNKDGGFLCHNHLNGHDVLPVERLKKFRLIIKANFSNYDVLKDFIYDFRDFDLLMSFFIDHSEVKLRSYDLFKTLNI